MKCVKDGQFAEGDDIPWNPLCAEAKEWKASVEAKGYSVIGTDEREALLQAERTIQSDKRIAEYLKASERQVMIVGEYQDHDTQLIVPVKVLIDLVPSKDSKHSDSLGDLKTARNASPGEWQSVVDKRNYDAQAAMCLDMFNDATGEHRTTFVHVIVENEPPFQPARRFLSQDFLEIGRMKVKDALQNYCKCLKSGVWPDWDDSSEFNGWGIVQPEHWMMAKLLR